MNSHQLLIQATEKLVALSAILEWKDELLSKAPPVLWFGNSKSEKPRVLTLGANPSRSEFLTLNNGKKWDGLRNKSIYESNYLPPELRRFHHLNDKEDLTDIIYSEGLRQKIIDSFDNYFQTGNSYHWFGSNSDFSYKVEGFLNGFGASFFGKSQFNLSACHIDLFPFATISDFKRIASLAQRDIFAQNWHKILLINLIDFLKPEGIVVFGRSNYHFIRKNLEFGPQSLRSTTVTTGKGKCDVWVTSFNGIPVTGLSVNLGNPRGFDAVGLNSLGKQLA